MRVSHLSCIITVLISLTATAQAKEAPNYNAMPPEGIYLTEGWRYNPDDNPDFADPAYIDDNWETIDPSSKLHLLPRLKEVKTGWLRLHFSIGQKLSGKTLLIIPWQNCASEIYLDGKFIKRYGVLSDDPSKVIPTGMNQPGEAIYLTPGKEHVLAVRFSIWKGAFLLKNNSYFFLLNMSDLSVFQEQLKIMNAGNEAYFVLVSIFFLISLLHLSFYKYDPAQRANLFFSLYTITSTIAFLLVCMQSYVEDARLYIFVLAPAFFAALLGSIWTVKALGSLYGFAVRQLVTVMWAVYTITLGAIVCYDVNLPFYLVFVIFQSINIWLVIKAFKAGKRGAGIIVAGFLVSAIMLILTVLEIFVEINLGLLTLQIVIGLTYLAPAVGISLYLAREFALNSGLLREKLLQVKALSEKNLQHEQEKQALLSQQNEILEKQVADRTSELEHSFHNLREAQNQLIQSEKMASLGELTAGIAHEIQNPLNFVNNFSDVSVELLQELKEETAKGDLDEVNAIADDVMQNLEKIAHHGRRADSIVKGMLQHSRTSAGQKEPTDVNALADEYLRLAYHGLRAKDKNFNCELITEFDLTLQRANVIPQDIGRVLLNLFNNAFYAIQEKSKQLQLTDGSYKPTVTVRTKQKGTAIEICIEDNGVGIPDVIKDKILQPFFTTKPTGDGTGLGLSLSYDIVVKGHGGRIEIESTEGQGSEFKILLAQLKQ